jgi:hypothetical protein
LYVAFPKGASDRDLLKSLADRQTVRVPLANNFAEKGRRSVFLKLEQPLEQRELARILARSSPQQGP